ncbi:hypothetical protein J7K93_02595 [bacterium]|nr:hypothetical protein [bacterium]
MKKITIILKLLLINLILSNILYAQPYKYYFSGEWNHRSISRINLQTGVMEVVIPDCYIGLQLFVTPDQQKIIYTDRSQIYAFDIHDLSNKIVIMSKTRADAILQIIDSPKTNRLFLVFGDVDQTPYMTIMFDRETFAHLDSLYGIYFYSEPFLSEDEKKIYRLIPDKEGIFFKVFNTSGEIVEEKMRHGDLGPFIDYNTYLNDCRLGQALVSFEYPNAPDFINQYYVVCDPEANISNKSIPFPWRSEAYLSPDAQNVIIEEVQFIKDDDPNTPGEYRPGNVFVFDAETGVLKQRLKLPPEGEILLFDNFPDQMFYYQQAAPQSTISIDVTLEQLDTELIDMLINDVNTAYGKGWIDNKGIANSLGKKLENAKKQLKKGEKKTAVNNLNAFVNEVEAQKDKHLTSETYALLKYNTEFLIERLSQE